ncbi:hypothetical protein GCM10007159_02500 [Modicisalibacter luteus]|nr:hypothetical protein GCM10007159_02500 [Halomonas lutea]
MSPLGYYAAQSLTRTHRLNYARAFRLHEAGCNSVVVDVCVKGNPVGEHHTSLTPNKLMVTVGVHTYTYAGDICIYYLYAMNFT